MMIYEVTDIQSSLALQVMESFLLKVILGQRLDDDVHLPGPQMETLTIADRTSCQDLELSRTTFHPKAISLS